jgi:hypothetical protein
MLDRIFRNASLGPGKRISGLFRAMAHFRARRLLASMTRRPACDFPQVKRLALWVVTACEMAFWMQASTVPPTLSST